MKVNYGIHIGFSSASIAKMEAGVPFIIPSFTLKDSTPVAVFVNKKRGVQVGDAAYNVLKREKLKAMNNWDSGNDNSFVEFTRTLGSDVKYESINAKRSFSSEELLAEMLKCLLSYEQDFDINAAVITVPAVFMINQINAVRKAGYLAGLKQIEIITQPEAAAWVYGLNTENNDGYLLVFDFDDGSFNTALIKVDDGIRQVIDSDGDKYLGGENIDEAIVDKIIIPYLKNRFAIDKLLSNDYKNMVLRTSMKFYAEEIKKQLSFSDETRILSYLGDIPGEDQEGNELELDITVTAYELENAIAPVFQKSIDISQKLLKRNNLDGSKLAALILVGGPTLSPVLRKMLASQICKPDTSVDPMTVLAKGAAIYASTIKRGEGTIETNPTRIQLEINFESTTVEEEEDGVIKILADKTESEIPEKVFANISRQDGGWSSGNVEINSIGEIVTVQLVKGKSNSFLVSLYDEKGNKLECEPSSFNILRESRDPKAVLPYNIGAEIKDKTTGKIIFRAIKGLEKNKSLPATGTLTGIKTKNDIRPGMDSDFIKISLYQGEHGSEGTRVIYNEHVYDIIISGSDLPCLFPKDSEIDLTISIDKSQTITIQAYFPSIDFTFEIDVTTSIVNPIETSWLLNEIRKAKDAVSELKRDSYHSNDAKLQKAESELEKIEKYFENNKYDVGVKKEILTNLRRTLKTIDKLLETTEWPKLEAQLKEEHYRLEGLANSLQNDAINNIVSSFKSQIDEVLRTKDIKLCNVLLNDMFVEINRIDAINEKYDREYLQLYDNGEMTLLDVKDSLEEANRQDSTVYKEVLVLIRQEKKNVTKVKVEDLLFKLTEDGLISAKTFQEFYEQLLNLNGDAVQLEKLNNDIKAYESK